MPDCPFPSEELQVVGFNGGTVADGCGVKDAMIKHAPSEKFFRWDVAEGAIDPVLWADAIGRWADLWTMASGYGPFRPDGRFMYVDQEFMGDSVAIVLAEHGWPFTWYEQARVHLAYLPSLEIETLLDKWADSILAHAREELNRNPTNGSKLAMRARYCIPSERREADREAFAIAYAATLIRQDKKAGKRIYDLIPTMMLGGTAEIPLVRRRALHLIG